MERITFAAGCFWGVEDKFKNQAGVTGTASGYMGGEKVDPTYKEVCTGSTGHAEVVQVDFDPTKIGLEDLLAMFWSMHDPTTLNRQGPDVGTQYRSAIFCENDEQLQFVQNSKNQQQSTLDQPIVTEVELVKPFYKAEEYHQCYLEKNGLGSCH